MANLPYETLSDIDPALDRSAGAGEPQAHLFRVFECSLPLAPSARHCLIDLERVEIGRGERHSERRRGRAPGGGEHRLALGVPDPWMSSSHARLVRSDAGWCVEDAGSRNGTLVNGAAVERAVLGDGDILELGRSFFVFRSAQPHAAPDPLDLESTLLASPVSELASLSVPLAQQIHRVVQIADAGVSIVVLGETGTGKERIANAVHVLSRRPGSFIAVNCGALPETLVETELFGCRRGAFTGAADRPGLVRAADRGTLFLDEIGDLPLSAQVALLRVLQERQVHPVGATHPVPVDFRLICATQQPLEELVRAGRFRSDLMARLAGITVQLPPLRERREDLGIITATLLRRLAPARAERVAFDKDAARALIHHPFPRNIRELEKILERALALAGDVPIRREHLLLDEPGGTPPSLPARRIVQAAGTLPPDPDASARRDARWGESAGSAGREGTGRSPVENALPPEDIERKHELIARLGEHGGNLSATARAMGKARVQIRRWLRRYQIDPAQFRR